MSKNLYIAEKPSVAKEFVKALNESGKKYDGYIETDSSIFTWCVGHLVTMSYPESYDIKYKKWRLDTLPFIPEKFKYEIIGNVKKQFDTVSFLLHRDDVETIFVCTDSGREGEYIYRLVEQMSGVKGKNRRRVWIDSQTEEEILRGIKEAKDLSEYDNLSASAYLRAKEDYLMGINFSRLLTLKFGDEVSRYLNTRYSVISIGRVMTCVLGMVVRREREIRDFVKTPFYRVILSGCISDEPVELEWKSVEGSEYFGSPKLYKENGFKSEDDAKELIAGQKLLLKESLKSIDINSNNTRGYSEGEILGRAVVEKIERKSEKKNPPLLYNLAELQNHCSKLFKISPDETLAIVQELYEKKLVTYPRTDARVLSTAISKEIEKNLRGLMGINMIAPFAEHILSNKLFKGLEKTRYVNDKQITDHYAIIPTGQGLGSMRSLKPLAIKVYETIVRRFIAIFYPPAVYQKIGLTAAVGCERYFSNFKVLKDAGYLAVMDYTFKKKKNPADNADQAKNNDLQDDGDTKDQEESVCGEAFMDTVQKLKNGELLDVLSLGIKEGETSPPKRYNSGSLILAMENAGQLIEDEELRAEIKGSGIGTSATRAEILKKLNNIKYLQTAKKTQIVTPTLLGEMVYDIVLCSMKSLLNPELTASWEKGLSQVAEGRITNDEYMEKLKGFIERRTSAVMQLRSVSGIRHRFDESARYYKNGQNKSK